MERQKLVIDRAKWLRGTGDGALLNDAGYMCCLGFKALQDGCSSEMIYEVGEPWEVGSEEEEPLYPGIHDEHSWLRTDSGSLRQRDVQDLIEVNDFMDLPDEAREVAVRGIFRRHQVDVEFIN